MPGNIFGTMSSGFRVGLHSKLRSATTVAAVRRASSGRPQDATVRRVSSLSLRREGVSREDIWSDPNQTLAEILAAVQPRDRTRSLLDSVEDVLSIADLSVAHPALKVPQCFGTALNMIEDEKPLHSRPFDKKMTLDPWSLG